jgi:hypothetical protein
MLPSIIPSEQASTYNIISLEGNSFRNTNLKMSFPHLIPPPLLGVLHQQAHPRQGMHTLPVTMDQETPPLIEIVQPDALLVLPKRFSRQLYQIDAEILFAPGLILVRSAILIACPVSQLLRAAIPTSIDNAPSRILAA